VRIKGWKERNSFHPLSSSLQEERPMKKMDYPMIDLTDIRKRKKIICYRIIVIVIMADSVITIDLVL